jgi:TraM recognition site of TraD and TraG
MNDGHDHWAWEHQVELLTRFAAEDWTDRRRRHLFLGRREDDGTPFLVPVVRANPHAWVIGGAGTGKSALVLAPLVSQLLANRVGSVLVLDPKPDKALFESCRLAAGALGLRFRHVCVTPGRSSFAFPPLRQSHTRRQTPTARAEMLIQALNLDYGHEYGGSYYTATVEAFVRGVLTRFPDVQSPGALADLLDRPESFRGLFDKKTWDDSNHVRALIAKLGDVTSLNVTPDTPGVSSAALTSAVDFADLFRQPQVVYFALDSAQVRTTTRAVIGLAVSNLLAAAAHTASHLPPGGRVPVACVIDEAQEVIAPNLEIVLDQARDLGVQLVLAHQNLEQLRRKERDYRGVLEENTGLQVVFGPIGRGVREWIEQTGGQRLQADLKWEQDHHSEMDFADGGSFHPSLARWGEADWGGWFTPPKLSVGEKLVPRYDRDVLRALSARAGVALVRVTQDSGYAQAEGDWTAVRLLRHISEEEFVRRKALPWPAATPEMVTVSHEPRRRPPSADPTDALRQRIARVSQRRPPTAT